MPRARAAMIGFRACWFYRAKDEKEGMLFLTSHPTHPLASVCFPDDGALSPPWHPDLMLEFCDAELLVKAFTDLSVTSDTQCLEAKSLTLQLHGETTFKISDAPSHYVDMNTGEVFPPSRPYSKKETQPRIIIGKWVIVAGESKEPLVQFLPPP